MTSDEIVVSFKGPFSWTKNDKCPNLFRQEVSNLRGLYLWTVPQSERELIYYVGITGRSFHKRMEEHFKEHCAGAYHLNEPEKLRNGNRKCIWPGFFDQTNKKNIAELVENYDNYARIIVDLSHIYRFYLAPLELENRKLERIEAALAMHLYNQPGEVGAFQEKGVIYKARNNDETPFQARFESKANLIGIPDILEV